MDNANILACDICKRKYKHASSLSRHRRECINNQRKREGDEVIRIENLIIHLQKQIIFYRDQSEKYFNECSKLENENKTLKTKIKAYES